MKTMAQSRNAELGKIHIAVKDLGWSDAEYRNELQAVCLVRSAGLLDHAGRQKFLDHLKAIGWRPRYQKQKWRRPNNFQGSADRTALLNKIQALLTDAGRPWAYAEGVCRNVTKPIKERIEFCTPDDLRKIVIALEYDARRRLSDDLDHTIEKLGVSWNTAHDIAVRAGKLSSKADLKKNSAAMSFVIQQLHSHRGANA